MLLIVMFLVIGLSVIVLNYMTRQLEGFYTSACDIDPESEECQEFLSNI